MTHFWSIFTRVIASFQIWSQVLIDKIHRTASNSQLSRCGAFRIEGLFIFHWTGLNIVGFTNFLSHYGVSPEHHRGENNVTAQKSGFNNGPRILTLQPPHRGSPHDSLVWITTQNLSRERTQVDCVNGVYRTACKFSSTKVRGIRENCKYRFFQARGFNTRLFLPALSTLKYSSSWMPPSGRKYCTIFHWLL